MNNIEDKLINISNIDTDYENINFFNFDLDINNINKNQLEGNNNIISMDSSKYILINFNYLNNNDFYNPVIKTNINNTNNDTNNTTIPLSELINNISATLNDKKNIIINLDTFLSDLLKSFKNNDIIKQLELDFHRSNFFINYKKIFDLEQIKYYFEYKTQDFSYVIYNKYNLLDIIYAIHTQAIVGSIYEYLYKILKIYDIHIVEISNKIYNNSLSFYTNIYNNCIYINVSKRLKLISLNYRNNYIDLGEIKIDINFSFYLNELNFTNNEYAYFSIIYNKN